MKLEKPKNSNYCATVVIIKNIMDLQNCDNVKGSIIFGDQVIISKETKIGDIGIYFPPETQLSAEFLANNNLYREKILNKDLSKMGYFEQNGRVRTVKFRGNKSVGFWIPINCLSFTNVKLEELPEGAEFDKLNNFGICTKYIIKRNPPPLDHNARERRKIRKQTKNRIIDNQFRFHEDTKHFAKNVYRFSKDSLISITAKIHGTSVISSKVLCKKDLNFFLRGLKKLGVKIVDTEYSNLYASRKVIKNGRFDTDKQHFYNVDIWGKANDVLKEFLLDGMTIYAEVVGHLPSGAYIQKPYDYGCENTKFEVYIYRITYTNPSGKVFEFSAKQVQDWCKERGLKVVPQLFYGTVEKLFEHLWVKNNCKNNHEYGCAFNQNLFLTLLQKEYLEKDCVICKNMVPDEGIVVRIEQNDLEVYKLKSTRFLEFETAQLDKGEVDIEETGDDTV